ncbi:hypothetical protein J6590_030372, partial [Homalodisca vitripennis]
CFGAPLGAKSHGMSSRDVLRLKKMCTDLEHNWCPRFVRILINNLAEGHELLGRLKPVTIGLWSPLLYEGMLEKSHRTGEGANLTTTDGHNALSSLVQEEE